MEANAWNLKNQFKHLNDKIDSIAIAVHSPHANSIASCGESQQSAHDTQLDDIRKDISDKFKDQSQKYETLRDWLKENVQKLEDGQMSLLAQIASNSRDMVRTRHDLNFLLHDRQGLESTLSSIRNELANLRKPAFGHDAIVALQIQNESQRSELETMKEQLAVLQSRIAGISVAADAVSSIKQDAFPPALDLLKSSVESLRASGVAPNNIPSTENLARKSEDATVGMSNAQEESAAATENSVQPIDERPSQPARGKSLLRGDAPQFQWQPSPSPEASTPQMFSTGLEKSKYAPPNVKVLFGMTDTFLTPQKQSKAIRLVKPPAEVMLSGPRTPVALPTPPPLEIADVATIQEMEKQFRPARQSSTTAIPESTSNISTSSSQAKAVEHANEVKETAAIDVDPELVLPDPPVGNQAAANDKVDVDTTEKAQNPVQNRSQDREVKEQVDFASANAAFQVKLQQAVYSASEAAERPVDKRKEYQRPMSPLKNGKQDFVAQMMAGLSDFQKKYVHPKSAKSTPDPVPTPKVSSASRDTSLDTSESHDSKEGAVTVMPVALTDRLNRSTNPRLMPAEKESFERLEKSIAKVKAILATAPGRSLVMNLSDFTVGLYMPISRSGDKVQVRVSAIGLRQSEEAEMSLQLRCDDFKTIHLIFQGKCTLVDPPLTTVVRIKPFRTIGSNSFLTKHKPNESSVDIYGMQFMFSKDDPGVRVQQHPQESLRIDCRSKETLQYLQLCAAFKDPGAKKFAVRFTGNDIEASATWARVDTFLKKVDEPVCKIMGQKWEKKEGLDGDGTVWWKLAERPWIKE